MINLLAVQRQRVVDDWEEVKAEIQPVRNMFGAVGKMAKGTTTSPLVSTGIKIATDVFLKNFVLAKAGWITRLAVPFVVRNYSSHMLADKGNAFVSKLANLFKGKRRRAYTAPPVSAAPVSTVAVDVAPV